MSERSSDNDKSASQPTEARATAQPDRLPRGSRKTGNVAAREVVGNEDTVFGGGLLEDARRHLEQNPPPLTKRQLADKYALDVKQVLAAFPKLTPKDIIAMLANRDPAATGATFERRLAVIINEFKTQPQPQTKGVKATSEGASHRPSVTGARQQRKHLPEQSPRPALTPPTRDDSRGDGASDDAAPGLFARDLSGSR